MLNLKILSVICGIELVGAIGNVMGVAAANEILLGGTCLLAGYTVYLGTENFQKKTCPECKSKIRKAIEFARNVDIFFSERAVRRTIDRCY